nr:hypothetical protein [Caballeronia sp. GAFFF2]
MMREVTGAFFGSRKLDEALEDLKAEGITSDRVRVASMSGFADFTASMELSASSPTQWITAEFAGYADLAATDGGYGIASTGSDDILPGFDNDESAAYGITRVFVSIRDEAEMRAVCDIFSRLGTDDIDAEVAAA